MTTPKATINLNEAIQQGRRLLNRKDFALARQQGEAILQQRPDEPNAQFLVATALRQQGRCEDAQARLTKLLQQVPSFALAHQELGLCLEQLQQAGAALDAFENAVKHNPKLGESWQKIAELQQALGNPQAAQAATLQLLQASQQHPRLVQAMTAFQQDQLSLAEQLCRQHIHEFPRDVSAIRLLADIAIRLGIYDDAEALLQRALALAPDYHLARLNLAHTLQKKERCTEALKHLEKLLQQDPQHPAYLSEQATVFTKLGRFSEAVAIFSQLTERLPSQPKLWNSLGHALKTLGQRDAAIDAYRRAIAAAPSGGEAYWSLADLKNYRFSDAEVAAMQQALNTPDLATPEAAQLHFALGKALEDQGQPDSAFAHYQQGNQLKRQLEPYSAEENRDATERTLRTCTPALFSNPQQGCDSAEPIFIVGLPRSGSTLLEQILASHSQVEGTKELPDLLAMVRRLSGRKKQTEAGNYPEVLARLSAENLRELGLEYLERTRIQRTGAPYFIDKMPNNFAHIGLIKRILPRAKIIDARRHPLASCFSAYKQHFAHGQAFSYNLADLGHYYADYVRLMDHWHKVLPNQILTLHYEQVVADFERQVRRLLDYCALPFEPGCLNFYDNKRAVRTASAEQVRQPINTRGLRAWAPFEAHLNPLKAALGKALTEYPYD